jgi:hypothetical protein
MINKEVEGGKMNKYTKIGMTMGLFVCLAISMIAFASAQIVAQNEPSELQFTCTIGNGVPSNSATYNISIYNPDGSVFVDNAQATAQGNGGFNYSVSLPKLGLYQIKQYCYDTGGNFSNPETIQVTADGKYTNFPMVYVLLILAGIFLIFSKYLNKLFDTNLFNIFASMLFMIAGILTIYPGFNYTNYSTLEGLTLGLIFIGLGATLVFKEMEDSI